MKIAFWKKTLFILVLLAGILLVLEVVLRFCGLGPAPIPVPIDPTSGVLPISPDPFEYYTVTDWRLGYRNRSNARYRATIFQGAPVSTTDEWGYRNGIGWPGEPDTPIVLFVGDSTTFGAEVNDDRSVTSETAKLLHARGYRVRVLNAAVRGYSILQSRRMIEECLERYPEIRVVIYTFCGNDPEESFVPGIHFPMIAPLLTKNSETGRYDTIDPIALPFPEGTGLYDAHFLPPEKPWNVRLSRWLACRSVVWHHAKLGIVRIENAIRSSMNSDPQYPQEAEPDPPDVTNDETPSFDFHCDVLSFYPPKMREEAAIYGYPSTVRIMHQWQFTHWTDWVHQVHGTAPIQQMLKEMDEVCDSHDAIFIATTFSTGVNTLQAAKWYKGLCDAEDVRCALLCESIIADKIPPLELLAKMADGRHDSHYGVKGTALYAEKITPFIEDALRTQNVRPQP